MKVFNIHNFMPNENKCLSHSVKIFGKIIFSIYYNPRIGWIRFFGRGGIKWKDITIHPLIFSEKSGHVNHLQIKNWRIQILKKI